VGRGDRRLLLVLRRLGNWVREWILFDNLDRAFWGTVEQANLTWKYRSVEAASGTMEKASKKLNIQTPLALGSHRYWVDKCWLKADLAPEAVTVPDCSLRAVLSVASAAWTLVIMLS